MEQARPEVAAWHPQDAMPEKDGSHCDRLELAER
jgi:hypothetical protein